MKQGAMYGLVPFKGMPDYVPYRRSSRDKLGVPPSSRGYRVSTSWKYSSEYSIAKGKFWYGGYIFDNFGHFITESVTRVWWYLQNYPNDYTAALCREIYRVLTRPALIPAITPGKDLRTQRETNGISQAQVAKALNTQPARISDIETDRRPLPTLRTQYQHWLQAA